MKKYLIVCLFVLSSSANAALIKSYDFNNNLTDTLGNGADLAASGGTLGAGRYSFSDNQGLRLTSALPSTSNYGIEVKFQINVDTIGWNKIIDFQELASDNGLYINDGTINFYPFGSNAGSVSVDSDLTVGLSRSGNAIEIFLNNTSVYSGVDSDVNDSDYAVSASNILNFFEDDVATSKGESFAGSVDFIRIHNDSSTFGTVPGAVPVPTAIWLFSSGLIGLIGLKRKSKAS